MATNDSSSRMNHRRPHVINSNQNRVIKTNIGQKNLFVFQQSGLKNHTVRTHSSVAAPLGRVSIGPTIQSRSLNRHVFRTNRTIMNASQNNPHYHNDTGEETIKRVNHSGANDQSIKVNGFFN